MSAPSIFENNRAFQGQTPSFNLVNQTSSFQSVFDTKPLDEKEALALEKLLVDNYQPGGDAPTEEQVQVDVEQLKRLTAEIRAIGKQGVVLMGERVYKARDLLKLYRDGTFTKWLEAAFGNRKTGYNLLSYYELHKDLPPQLRENLKRIPQRCAYILASRDGAFETKQEILRQYSDLPLKELDLLIKDRLPAAKGDRRTRKSSNAKLIEGLKEIAYRLEARKAELTEQEIDEVLEQARVIMDAFDDGNWTLAIR